MVRAHKKLSGARNLPDTKHHDALVHHGKHRYLPGERRGPLSAQMCGSRVRLAFNSVTQCAKTEVTRTGSRQAGSSGPGARASGPKPEPDRTVRRARRAEPGAATTDVGRLGSGSRLTRCRTARPQVVPPWLEEAGSADAAAWARGPDRIATLLRLKRLAEMSTVEPCGMSLRATLHDAS